MERRVLDGYFKGRVGQLFLLAIAGFAFPQASGAGSCPDCNANGVADCCEVSGGACTDASCHPACDHAGCSVEICAGELIAYSGVFSPLQFFTPFAPQLSWFSLPPAVGDVTLRFEAQGDLDDPKEFVQILINADVFAPQVFGPGGLDCTGLSTETVVISQAVFNEILTPDGRIDLAMIPAGLVDPCAGSYIMATMTYATALDCNAGGVPDGCDITGGTSMDVNGNGIPDECECVPGVYGDIEPAPTGDGDVDVDDLLCLLGVFSGLTSTATCDTAPDGPGDLEPCGGDADTDVDDILAFLGAFSGVPACPQCMAS